MTGRGDVWAAAFAKPSKLWWPAPSWEPREWTPLPVALGQITDRVGDFGWVEIDLHRDFVTGRIKSALRYPLSDDRTKELQLFLQPRFWQHLNITVMRLPDVLVDGEVEGRRLELAGWLFFMATADLDKHYPVAASPAVAQQPEPGPRQPPGPRPKGDWKFAVGTELIRLAYVDPAALKNRAKLLAHMREFLKQEIKWVPKDDKQIAKVIKAYLVRIE
jgi:hypothetical protein